MGTALVLVTDVNVIERASDVGGSRAAPAATDMLCPRSRAGRTGRSTSASLDAFNLRIVVAIRNGTPPNVAVPPQT